MGSLKEILSSVQSLSCVWLFATPWSACSTSGLPVHHQLPEFIQSHVHCVSDAIQPSHPLSSPSPSAFNLSQHQGQFFVSGGQSIEVSVSASVLPMNIQDWFPLGWTGWIFLLKRLYTKVMSSVAMILLKSYSSISKLSKILQRLLFTHANCTQSEEVCSHWW